MRQFAGFGTAEETNQRFRYLLDHGQAGLSTAFDMPSLMGHDSDHPRSLGEVGREGVAVDTLDDMETLFEGIDLGEVSVSMTINAPAAIMMAFYVVAAEEKGIPSDALAGTVQADILKEYIAQKEWCFPVDPAMRLLGDMMQWCTGHMRARDLYPDWDAVARDVVGALRSAAGRKPRDRALSDLVGELSTRSEEFRQFWARHDVRVHSGGVKRLHHPQVGDMELRYEGLDVVSDTDLTIYVYTAEAGSRSAAALSLLSTLAATAAVEQSTPTL